MLNFSNYLTFKHFHVDNDINMLYIYTQMMKPMRRSSRYKNLVKANLEQ